MEDRHPALAQVSSTDPRHPWRRALDTAALLRAAVFAPVRALTLAARERALSGSARAGRHDPDPLALRHALRVHCVLAAAAAAGQAPTRADAGRYVREQRSTAVLLGAEPDDLPGTLAEVGADVARVRAGLRPAGPLLVPADGLGDDWARTSVLALALLPSWARPVPSPISREELATGLRGLGEDPPRR